MENPVKKFLTLIGFFSFTGDFDDSYSIAIKSLYNWKIIYEKMYFFKWRQTRRKKTF
jgi:hypothetical protein